MTDTAVAGRPFDAVLCDVDNVIRFYDGDGLAALERSAGLAEGTTRKVAFTQEAVLPVLLGHITPQEWVASIARGLTDLTGLDEATSWELGAALLESPFHADATVVALLRRARVHVPLVLVSNATLNLESDLESLGLADFLDEVVNSARVGLAKPDPAIFHLATAKAGVRPERCLFVDDTLENVRAATELGMRAVHFRTAADLEQALEPLFS